MIRVVVSGAAGKMGEAVCEAVEGADGMELVAKADPALDQPLADFLDGADVCVDFSTPETALDNIKACVGAGVHVVVGTTGFDLDEARKVVAPPAGEAEEGASDQAANVFIAPNFAIGAVLMMIVSQRIAEQMPEAEIVELHHEQKKDAPSGTAKRTADLIEAAGGNVHEIHSVRLPGLVAHQEVVFGGEGQTLSIRHDSIDRRSFMPGVLLAVRKVAELSDRFTVGLENLL